MVVNFSLRSGGAADLVLVSDIETGKSKLAPKTGNLLLSNAGLKPGLYTVSRIGLQLPGLSELSYGEKHEQDRHSNGDADKPAGSVARPSAQGGVQPSQRENGKDRGNDFVKKLAKRAPETTEAAVLLRRGSCACGR